MTSVNIIDGLCVKGKNPDLKQHQYAYGVVVADAANGGVLKCICCKYNSHQCIHVDALKSIPTVLKKVI